MTKDKAYALTGLWAFFMGLIHAGRKYFTYKANGQEEMMDWKVLSLHFLPTFGILLLIGSVFIFVYFKFVKKEEQEKILFVQYICIAELVAVSLVSAVFIGIISNDASTSSA